MNDLEKKLAVLKEAGFADATPEDVAHYEQCDYLTENTINGISYYWYLDPDGCEAAMNIDTEHLLNKEELEALS